MMKGPSCRGRGVRGVLGRGSGISGEGREVETALECNRAGVTAILNWLRLASLIRPNGGSLSPALTTAFSSVDCGCMHAGLALGRERVASVGVSRPDLSVGAVDEELAALVAGHTPGDVDGLRLCVTLQALLAPSPLTCQEPSPLLVTCWFLEVIRIDPLAVAGGPGFCRARAPRSNNRRLSHTTI